MPSKRIIPCLDVKDGMVVKGVKFRNHVVLGDILTLAQKYRDEGADELVFYDIMASSENRSVDTKWVRDMARLLDIPFCVAGGIRNKDTARAVLNAGADKVSINTPALERPELIQELAEEFGSQCVVVGVDSRTVDGDEKVFLYTGDETKTVQGTISTWDWLKKVQELGAGEIVLNCMDSDGTGDGYDLTQLKKAREILNIPLVASGGAKRVEHFADAFSDARVDAALAAGVFHRNEIKIYDLKKELQTLNIEVRL